MTVYADLWSDEQGENADKVQQHGLTRDEWRFVFENYHIEEQSRSSDRLIRIGNTMDGRNVCVVFAGIEIYWCVLLITGYDVGEQ